MPIAKRVARARKFRGALVCKTVPQTIDRTSDGYVTFEAEDPSYDCVGIHDRNTNNSRLTVPNETRRVRLTANLCLANAADFYRAEIQKNRAASFFGLPRVNISKSPDVRTVVNMVSAPLVVTPGDYFEVKVSTNLPPNAPGVVVDSTWPDTWFAMELLD